MSETLTVRKDCERFLKDPAVCGKLLAARMKLEPGSRAELQAYRTVLVLEITHANGAQSLVSLNGFLDD